MGIFSSSPTPVSSGLSLSSGLIFISRQLVAKTRRLIACFDLIRFDWKTDEDQDLAYSNTKKRSITMILIRYRALTVS